MSAQQSNAGHAEKQKKQNKSGLYIVLAFVVITIVAMFTNGFGLFSNRKNESRNETSYLEKTMFSSEKTNEARDSTSGSESKITITGEQPSENNILIPPGSTYQLKTSVPVNILFEDADGNQVEDSLRPGNKEKNFPQMTPVKIWRKKPGQSVVTIIYSEN